MGPPHGPHVPRRAVLAGAGAAVATVQSGCLGAADDEESEEKGDRVEKSTGGCPDAATPEVEIEAPTVSPGSRGTLRVEVTNTTTLNWGATDEHADDGVEIGYTADGLTPSMDVQLDAYPPIWVWEDCVRRMEAELPVAIAADTDRGDYELTLMVSRDRQPGEQREVDFTITVE